jgi:hypothetical protein
MGGFRFPVALKMKAGDRKSGPTDRAGLRKGTPAVPP